jgi:flavin reductase (DIM6/NTAB) family NADH-FMN oxidoreductase RutF
VNAPDEGFEEVPEDQFLGIMSSFPAGVVVVTSLDAAGKPYGLTVSAFCSVSRVPPLILVCVDQGSTTLPAIQASGKFTVNFLSEGREKLALNFATKEPDKFADAAWRHPERLQGGGPVLHEDTVAHVACTVEQAHEAGDHWVFIGRVVEADLVEDARSLLFHRRTFSGIG